MTPQRAHLSNGADAVEEFFTEAKIESLNATLLARGISSERIITILPVPGQALANPTPPQFRVLYRKN